MATVIHVRRLSLKIAQILLVLLGYCSVSIVLVFANKRLVGNQDSAHDVSLFVVWVQCLVTVLFMTWLNVIRALWTQDWKSLAVRRGILFSRPVLRMSFTFVSMLAFNNMCLRYVDVSFYQVARSLTIIFMVVFSITILKRAVTWKVVTCCVVVACGFFLGIDQEKLLGNLSVTGVVYGISSSVFVAINGIFTKQALDVVDGNSYKLTFYSNINAAVLFVPVVFVSGQFKEAELSLPNQSLFFWIFLFTTGILCFFIAWIGGIQINLTSPLTHTIIANSKAILQTLIAVLYFEEAKPTLWWISNMLVVGGAFSYTVVKMREETAKTSIQSPISPITMIAQMEKGENGYIPGTDKDPNEDIIRKTPNGL